MKKINIHKVLVSMLFCMGLTLVSCDDDKDIFQISENLAPTTITPSTSTITITEDDLRNPMLSLSYESVGPLVVNGEETNAGVYILQSSLDKNFPNEKTSNTIMSDTKGANTHTLTGMQLNILALNNGIEGGETGTMYFRIVHAISSTDFLNAAYSDPITVTITTYKIKFVWFMLAGAEKTVDNAVDSLYSANEDGVYTGFISANAWFNWTGWDMFENAWGTCKDENWQFCKIISRKTASTESEDTQLHQWMTANEGCCFVTVDTKAGEVEYKYVKDLSFSGDVEGTFLFDDKKCQYTTVITTAADNQNINISGNTLTYNSQTGEESAAGKKDEKGIPGTISLTGANGIITIGEGEINIPKAGSYKLVIDLDNSSKYTYKLEDLSNAVIYPEKVTAVVGETEVELRTEIESGLASGIYTGKITATATSFLFNYSDNKKYEVSVVDAEGNVLTELEIDNKYNVTVDLVNKKVTFEKINWEIPTSISIYSDAALTDMLATYYSNDDNKFSGLYYQNENWNFYGKDNNGIAYGVQNWSANNNNQFTFFANSSDKFWIDPNTPWFITINAAEEGSWTATEVTNMQITGAFNEWDIEGNKKVEFQQTGNPYIWTATITTADGDEYNPQIVFNHSWENKLYSGANGILTPKACKDSYPTKKGTTYTVTVNFINNTVTYRE
ncbi:MAG: DUF5114 domain-containing protein, partial [Bacteroidales bacterium]|nr:DUF5114 domain-containing protein [Bacteroidales bacterium]